ncbi:HAD-IC family P-type ATPase [Rothia aerolata]|uniref:Haloacid dehalogenase n=1 Tax=Rothia aerolata TaxID=1812262 RepID=A0A917ISZ1_9MICC|nr:HAD-IC family P-type ATPase [Rothia aerolata]GGH61839.1 haloacid dehalogenase [Rothia aerolata]
MNTSRETALAPATPLGSGLPEQAHELAQRGLTGAQVEDKQRQGLVNRQDNSTSRSTATIVRTHLFTLFNLVLGACGAVVIMLGRWLDLLFLLAAIANIVVGFVQEFSAKKKLDRIALLKRDPVQVIRDGARQQVPMEQLVEGDVVVLSRGDQVPADATVLTSEGLDLDESMLTGENDPVAKMPGDRVLSASAVVGGSGRVQLTAVGAKSHAAKLSREAKKFSTIHSELRAAMERVVRWITWALIPIIAIVLNGQMVAAGGWGPALESGAWQDALIVAVSSIASMIPQGLALMTTISFATAAVKLAQHEVLIQEQPAVEVLARVDVVCFDKTGTLTEGGVRFSQLLPLVDEDDAAAAGTSRAAGSPAASFQASPQAQAALAWFGADENANPTAAALAAGFENPPADGPTGTIAFNSAARFSAVEFADSGAWILGAPEVLLAAGSRERHRAGELAARGLRTMVLAAAEELNRDEKGQVLSSLPKGLSPLFFVIFKEQVRTEAPETLAYFREQGIELKVISGDNPRTVAAAATQAGMIAPGSAEVQAVDMSELPDDGPALEQAVASHSVFGRVNPQQKKNMVLALQKQGRTVAMTGDGINDALALKHADLGIAMGNAAPATKAVSRLVLLDGRFDRLPSVLAEGRKIIANIEKVTHLFLTKTSFAILLGVVLGILCWQFPFLPRQYSTADLLIVGGPAFFITLFPNTRKYVPGFLNRALHYAIPAALIIVAMLVAVNFIGRSQGVGTRELETASFITLVIMGVYNITTAIRPLRPYRLALVAAMYAGMALALFVPLLATYHQFALPSGSLGSWALGLGLIGVVLIELNLQLHRRWLARKHPNAVAAERASLQA